MADHSQASVIITGLFHDLMLKRSLVSVVWSDDSEKRLSLPVPYGCSLDDVQAEAEKAVRGLSEVTATISIKMSR
jgi:hypothetical protein